MSDFKIPHFQEQSLTCRSLVSASKNVSESMQNFVQWTLTGFGAGLTFLLGNLDGIKSHIPLDDIKTAGRLFLFAAVIGIFQRYLAMLIKTATNAFAEGEKLPSSNVDIPRFFIIYISSVLPVARFAVAWTARNFMRGNFTQVGRVLFTVCYIQCILGLVVAVLLLVALGVTLRNL